MIKFIKGNIFESNAEALVNTVNTKGVMGKGIAYFFKERFPENFRLYKKACEEGKVTTGKMFVTQANILTNPKWIINFPTKKHWRQPSSYKFIEEGLDDLIKVIKKLNIKSIAIPALGAGQGRLQWEQVKRIIEDKLSKLDIEILVYEPDSTKFLSVSTNAKLTKEMAMLLYLVKLYSDRGYEITLLEIQKLAYFLQRLGQTNLKLQFKKYYNGPYASNLQYILDPMRGTYIITEKPIPDSRPNEKIHLNKEKSAEIKDFIDKHCSDIENQGLKIISKMIEEFDSPMDLELLATVDWILFKDHENKIQTLNDLEKAINDPEKEKLKKTSKRPKEFKKEELEKALKRLKEFKDELSLQDKIIFQSLNDPTRDSSHGNNLGHPSLFSGIIK